MPLPSLPEHLWFRISTHLDPADLSSLSQVNRFFHRIATNQNHFIRHLPIPQQKLKYPSLLYRRQRALLYPPQNIIRSYQLQKCVAMLSIRPDRLLFVDITQARLIIAPGVLRVNMEKLLGMAGKRFVFGIHYSALRHCAVSLPQDHVAFIAGTYNTTISILNMQNGEVSRHSIPGIRAKHKLIVDGKSIVAAGNSANWLMFYSDPYTISLFDWKTGSMVAGIDIRLRGRIIAYMTHECPGIGGMSVVGFVTEAPISKNPCNKEVLAFAFDGSAVSFIVPREVKIAMVLRSMDRRTVVLLMRSGSPENKIIRFLARRMPNDSTPKTVSGNLSMHGWPELQDNGHVLAVRGAPFCRARHNLPALDSSWQIAAVLNDDGSVENTIIQQLGARAPPIWFRRTCYGWLVLMACRDSGWIEFVKLVRHETDWGEVLLRRWYIADIHDVCVLDDHWIFVTTLGGILDVIHFDRFCDGGIGIHACPLNTNNENGGGGCNSPERKRRRVAPGNNPSKST